MAWHIGPPREALSLSEDLAVKWHNLLYNQVAESKARWRLDAYVKSVSAPVTIADTFIDEWLEGLWRTDHK